MKKSQLTGLAGMAIIIIGTFLPYVTVGEQSFTMFSLGGPAKTVAILFIVLGLLSGVFAFFGKGKAWWLSILNLIVSGLAALLILVHINKLGKEAANVIGISVYVIAMGAVIGVVSSVMGIMKK
jgi:hypothetical protein